MAKLLLGLGHLCHEGILAGDEVFDFRLVGEAAKLFEAVRRMDDGRDSASLGCGGWNEGSVRL
jgi:hypothetical protein